MKKQYSFLFLMVSLFAFIKCKSADRQDIPQIKDTIAVSPGNSDTLSKSLYADGKPEEVILRKDSGACEKMVISFYPNGTIKTKGCQGSYSDKNISTGIFVGTWNTFDSSGHLKESVYYHNDEPAKAFIEKTSYYADGQRKSVERFNNYELYESEVDSIGEWKYYNNKGVLVNTIRHKK